MIRTFLLCLAAFSVSNVIFAAKLTYQLEPLRIAENTWVVQGTNENFSKKNGGFIVNTGFIVTEEGVVVIDTGPSRRFGEALKAAIKKVTNQPITHVFNTHHHPDHFLGNQAFSPEKIWALPKTIEGIRVGGNELATNMYRLLGDWMRGTETVVPTQEVVDDSLDIGKHRLRLLNFTGHTGADLVVYDETTGVVFASDMLFYQRTLTTPHTPGLDTWSDELARIERLNPKWIVPGHGPIDNTGDSIKQVRAYLSWLDQRLKSATGQGLSMNEVMQLPLDPEFEALALGRYEYVRSVFHLYSLYEEKSFE